MKIDNLYSVLKSIHGPQGKWWPGTAEEIIISAVLTQNTNWKNVERALENIKNNCKNDLLRCLSENSTDKIALMIKPAGFFNIKAQRLKNLLTWIEFYNFEIERIKTKTIDEIRSELLNIKGIGKETADSIILYAFELPIFVIDAYTRRILARIFDIKFVEYDEYRNFLESIYPKSTVLYQEFHGLIVEHAKAYCKTKPSCDLCLIENCIYSTKRKESES